MHQQTGRSIPVPMEESASWILLCLSPMFLILVADFSFIYFCRYYYNKITKESKWLIPEELKVSTFENCAILNILSYFLPHVFELMFLFCNFFGVQVGP